MLAIVTPFRKVRPSSGEKFRDWFAMIETMVAEIGCVVEPCRSRSVAPSASSASGPPANGRLKRS